MYKDVEITVILWHCRIWEKGFSLVSSDKYAYEVRRKATEESTWVYALSDTESLTLYICNGSS